MRIPSDKQDKLHGCLEHLFNQVGPLSHPPPDLGFVPSLLVRTHRPGAGAGLQVMGPCNPEGYGGPTNPELPATQVDSIHTLLKGPVMSRAFEETKHFPMDHSLQGEPRGVSREGWEWHPASSKETACGEECVLDGGRTPRPLSPRFAPLLPKGYGLVQGSAGAVQGPDPAHSLFLCSL